MKKKRNLSQKQKKKSEKLAKKRRSTRILVTAGAIIAVVIFVAVTIITAPRQIKFKNVDGSYVNPKTNVTYVPLFPFVYEANLVYSDDVYGTMDGDNVYEIDGANSSEWLARELGMGIISVYCASDITPPTLKDIGANSILVCEEDAVINIKAKITDSEKVLSIVSEYTSGEAVIKPEKITKTYNLRFSGENYPFLYYCVKYVVAENGYYYCSHEDGEYYPASDDIISYLESEAE